MVEVGIPIDTYHACIVDHLKVGLILALLVRPRLLKVG
jgi:hypothetical protein